MVDTRIVSKYCKKPRKVPAARMPSGHRMTDTTGVWPEEAALGPSKSSTVTEEKNTWRNDSDATTIDKVNMSHRFPPDSTIGPVVPVLVEEQLIPALL